MWDVQMIFVCQKPSHLSFYEKLSTLYIRLMYVTGTRSGHFPAQNNLRVKDKKRQLGKSAKCDHYNCSHYRVIRNEWPPFHTEIQYEMGAIHFESPCCVINSTFIKILYCYFQVLQHYFFLHKYFLWL